MNVPYAARFASVAFLVATLYTWLQMRSGLPSGQVLITRQAWLLNHNVQWSLGWWLWLLAIFSWMVLLVALMWSYLPAHRLASMLQSGLMVIAAVLAISGVIGWMHVLPAVFAQRTLADSLTPVVDALALGLLGAGCLMGGATTAWIALDLVRQKVLSRLWLLVSLFAGLCLLVAPFFQFNSILLVVSLVAWLGWCLWLSTRRRLPRPFAEWP